MQNDQESLIEFPCMFALKVMVQAVAGIEDMIIDLVSRHVGNISRDAITQRPSRHGNYIALTIMFEATSKQQLDKIYADLGTHPHVKMAL